MFSMSEILEAVATRLKEAGVAEWDGMNTPVPEGDDRVRVWAKHYPPVTPSLTVNVYSIKVPAHGEADTTYRVQIRTRAPHNADPLADKALQALDDIHHQEWAGVPVARCRHISTAQLGLDGQTDERTDNYEITTQKGKLS